MQIDPENLQQLGAAASGSGIAAALARATGWALFWMFVGGFSAAIFVGPGLARFFNLFEYQAGVGFVVGFLAIMVLRKVRDVIESIPAEGVGGTLLRWVQRMLGVTPGDHQERGNEK
jgi:hypothetical protein